MQKLIMTIAIAATVAACNSGTEGGSENGGDAADIQPLTENTLTDQEKADGWSLLFDGQTTNGWHTYGRESAGKAWKITDGALVIDTAAKKESQNAEGGDLCTNDEYENFDLKLQWKIAPGGNSGIIFYVREDTAKFHDTYESGPEMQVLDTERHPDGKIEKHHAGDLYDLIASTKDSERPVGEWNDVEIRSFNGKLDFFLNGENVVSTTMWDENWEKMIAGSKFKDMPGFGSFHSGKIALQDHGDMVSFRNIKIRRL